MDLYYVRTILLIVAGLATVISGGFSYKRFDKATRAIFLYTFISFLTECFSMYFAVSRMHNLYTYSVASIIESAVLCIYFNYSISRFRRQRIGIVLAFISMCLGVAHLVLFQSPGRFDNSFMLYQSILTITLSLFQVSELMLGHIHHDLRRNPHFWIGIILCFFFANVLFILNAIEQYQERSHPYTELYVYMLLAINIIFSLSLTILFRKYPKMI